MFTKDLLKKMMFVVGAVLVKDNRIILGKRADTVKNFPGLFEFPGGKIEHGETAKEALKRELLEELSISVDIENIREFKGNSHTCTFEKNGKQIHMEIFIVKNWKGKIKTKKHIHSSLAYKKVDSLEEMKDIIPGDKMFIPYIKKAL